MATIVSRIKEVSLSHWLILVVLFSVGVILLLVAGTKSHGIVKSVAREAGIVTIGTVLVALVYEFILRPEHDRQFLALLRDSLVMQAGAYGLYGVEKIDFTKLFSQLKRGDELRWLDTYCPGMKSSSVQDALSSALKRGATIRMLVINPESSTATARAEEIDTSGYGASDFKEEARSYLGIIQNVRERLDAKAARRLIIRMYSDLPCAPMYLVFRGEQPVAGWTSYFLSLPTYEVGHFLWGRVDNTTRLPPSAPGLGLEAFGSYFDGKWSTAKPIDAA